MSLSAPAYVTLTQTGPTVAAVWGAVTGATFYQITRYENHATFADRVEIGRSTLASFTDSTVPVVVYDSSSLGYIAAVWYYTISAGNASGIYTGTTQGITMAGASLTDVQSFSITKPILADGTSYEYDQITYGSTDSNTPAVANSTWIAYLRTIQT